MESELNIGLIIKNFRTEKEMTIKDLAENAQITSSMLSQIERGQANPSLNTIRLIAQALDIPLFKFFIENENNEMSGLIVTPEKRKHIISEGIEYELLTPTLDSAIEFMQLTLIPGTSTVKKPLSHKGEEVAIVIEGSVVIHIEENDYIMNKGDSIRIPAQTRHAWSNENGRNAIIIFAVTPPEF